MSKCLSPTKFGRCRKCDPCIDNRKNAWVLRMHLESMLYPKDQVTTATLTYRNEELPSSTKEAKEQLQKFMKRLRKDLFSKVRFFAALEKGSETYRYHWHIILFGLTFNFHNKAYIEKKWGHGFVRRWEPIRSTGGIAYAAKYALKDKCYLMSRNPGLGDGMVDHINKLIDNLSRAEKDKIIYNQSQNYFIDRAMGVHDPDRMFRFTALRQGGYYYPLHEFLKKRIKKFK